MSQYIVWILQKQLLPPVHEHISVFLCMLSRMPLLYFLSCRLFTHFCPKSFIKHNKCLGRQALTTYLNLILLLRAHCEEDNTRLSDCISCNLLSCYSFFPLSFPDLKDTDPLMLSLSCKHYHRFWQEKEEVLVVLP